MEIVKIIEQDFDLGSDIQTATLKNKDEVVILTIEGEVILYNFKTKKKSTVFTRKPIGSKKYPGNFDPTQYSTIYTLDDIIVVVNDFDISGYVYNATENYIISLKREDYYSKYSKYPIALFNYNDETHLLFSTKWNRVDIVNLNTRQILTADKSLIEKDAEQSHIEFYKKYNEDVKFFWPKELDYFYGELIMSPDEKSFLSSGWIWDSEDYFMIFDIEQFIRSNRVEPILIDVWEHNSRDVCFIDNTKVAVLFNTSENDVNFKGVEEDNVFHIRLYKTDGSREFDTITLETELDLNGAQMFFNIERQKFYFFSERIGLLVVSLSGKLELHQKNIAVSNYYNKYDCFIEYDKRKISIFKLDY